MKIRFKKLLNLKVSIKKKRGVLFLKNIPHRSYYKQIKDIFKLFGYLGRIFFVNHDKNLNKLNSKYKALGWIEYLNKKNAQQAYIFLKKHDFVHFSSTRISVKYLRNFDWNELIEFFS